MPKGISLATTATSKFFCNHIPQSFLTFTEYLHHERRSIFAPQETSPFEQHEKQFASCELLWVIAVECHCQLIHMQLNFNLVMKF